MAGSASNGKVAGVLDLGDLSPHTKPIKAQRQGEPIAFRGYVEGRRCPGNVRVAWFAAGASARQVAENAEATSVEREQAYYELLRDRLLAVVDGLEFEEAEVLAGDEDQANAILRYLGWIKDAEEAEDDSPEAVGASPLTGDASSPSSPQPIRDSDPVTS